MPASAFPTGTILSIPVIGVGKVIELKYPLQQVIPHHVIVVVGVARRGSAKRLSRTGVTAHVGTWESMHCRPKFTTAAIKSTPHIQRPAIVLRARAEHFDRPLALVSADAKQPSHALATPETALRVEGAAG